MKKNEFLKYITDLNKPGIEIIDQGQIVIVVKNKTKQAFFYDERNKFSEYKIKEMISSMRL